MSNINWNNSMNTITLSAADDTIDTLTVTDSVSLTSGSSGLYWGMNGTSASPGQVYTTNGTSPGWGNISISEPNLQGATLKVNGNAEFEGEVKIGGKNIAELFEKIEERLAILHPNEKLEDKWDELKELGRRYKELEAEIIEKEAMWAILKK